MDLQECISDTDRNGVFKITDKDTQVFKMIQSNAGHKHMQIFKLTGLTLAEPAEG